MLCGMGGNGGEEENKREVTIEADGRSRVVVAQEKAELVPSQEHREICTEQLWRDGRGLREKLLDNKQRKTPNKEGQETRGAHWGLQELSEMDVP